MRIAGFSHSGRTVLGGLAALACLAAAVHFTAVTAGAQAGGGERSATQPIQINFALRAVDQIVPLEPDVKIEQVIPFGKDNVFLVATTKRLIVFRVESKGGSATNIRLGEIPLLDDFSKVKEILVLDDKASFLVHTDRGIAVWAVTRDEIYATARR